MFENEIAINRLQLWHFEKVVADLPEDSLFAPGAGHGHPPVWILGHLAICAELGLQILGGEFAHPHWVASFGPGSSDRISPAPDLTKATLTAAILESYPKLQERAAKTAPAVLARPHGIQILEGSPVVTLGHGIALLLTNHFGFHLSQLSSCRRAAGLPAIF